MKLLKPSPPKLGFKKAELHTHSTYSDGVFDPEALAEKCHELGVKIWALTDHDTTAGCDRAKKAAEKYDIQFIPGIEISAHHGRSVHVLGYHVDTKRIAAYSKEQVQRRRNRMLEMIKRLNSQGVSISIDDVKLSEHADVYTRPHIAQALVKKGYGASIQDAFDQYIGEDCSAYVPSDWPCVEEAIGIIHDAGGIAVLAHPGIYTLPNDKNLDEMIPIWTDAGLDGLEAFHPRHSDAQEQRYKAVAESLGLFWTSSSDFHGPQKVGAERFGKVYLSDVVIEKHFNPKEALET